MRLGKFVEHLKAAAVASDSKVSAGDNAATLLKVLQVGRQLGYAGYMLMDNIAYFDQVGVKKFEGAVRVQREAYRAWLVGLSCNIAAGLFQLWQLRVRSQKQTEGAEEKVEAKKLEKYVMSDEELRWF